MTEVAEMRAAEMDLAKLGRVLFRLPLVTVQMGHLNPSETLLYIHPLSLEGEFMHDLLSLVDSREEGGIEAFCDRWFGDEEGALKLLDRDWAVAGDA